MTVLDRKSAPSTLRPRPVYDSPMPTATELLTASKIAAQLNVSGAKVKNAIATLKLKPAAKKGACSYYAASDVARIKKALG